MDSYLITIMDVKQYLQELEEKLKVRVSADKDILALLSDAKKYEKTLVGTDLGTPLPKTINCRVCYTAVHNCP